MNKRRNAKANTEIPDCVRNDGSLVAFVSVTASFAIVGLTTAVLSKVRRAHG